MIRTIGELLAAFIEKEKAALAAEKVTHRTTIGDMYEDLTADILERVIISTKPLQVVSGFIIKEDGSDSPEMDCMLVSGDATPIYRSDKVRCRLEDVVAVIQSKKTLNQSMLLEGIDNLAAVRKIKPSAGSLLREDVRRNFQTITRTPLPDDVATLPPLLAMIYHQLVVAAAYPTCIVISYGGYTTHKGFRKGIVESLKLRMGVQGYGPMGLPDLVLNQNFSCAKMVGHPWLVPLQDELWPLLATSEMRPTAIQLLETLYSKLTLRGLASNEIFGEDLDADPFTRLASYKLDPSGKGWQVRTDEMLDVSEPHATPIGWEPTFLTDEQHIFVGALCNRGTMTQENLAEFRITDADINFLAEAGLVGKVVGTPIRYEMLTTNCICGFLPDGRAFAGENNSGRTERWAANFVQKWRERKEQEQKLADRDKGAGLAGGAP